jgi:hypothetical protein
MEQADSEFLAWSIDDILDDLVDFGIPTTEEFQNIMSIEGYLLSVLTRFNFRVISVKRNSSKS